MTDTNHNKHLYIFLDEGGNFDFSKNGTKYFTMTSITVQRPFDFYVSLTSLKYDLMEDGPALEYFHASEDMQMVRDKVFAIIGKDIPDIIIDTVIVDKRKTNPALRDIKQFYLKMLGYLLKYICDNRNVELYESVIITTDKIPVNKKRQSVEKTIKKNLAGIMKSAEKPYQILHHNSKSSFSLQVVDYCNWAIFRKWEKEDDRSYDLIKNRIRSEFNIFEKGTTNYY